MLIYFFKDWLQIAAQGFGIRVSHDQELKHNQMLLWLLAIGSIPIGVGGILFNKQAETVWRTPMVMGIMLVAVGVIMWLAEEWSRKLRDMGSLNLTDAVSIGVAQALAIVPGCSRSGITISAGLFRNLTRESAARFSFLLSTPAIAAAALKALWDIHKHGGGLHTLLTMPFLVGRVGERIYRLHRDRLVSAIFASQQFTSVCIVSRDFWHYSACSGSHPPSSVMKLLSPTQHRRLNEVTGLLLLSLGLVTLLSLVSYYAQDPSWDTASEARPLNLVGYPGSYLSDLLFQSFGVAAFLVPLLAFLALLEMDPRSEELRGRGAVKIFGSVLLTGSLCAALSFVPLRLFGGTFPIGGTIGLAFATWLVGSLNLAGAVLATLTAVIVAVYLVSTFTISKFFDWLAIPAAWFGRRRDALRAWRDRLHQRSIEKARLKSLERRVQKRQKQERDHPGAPIEASQAPAASRDADRDASRDTPPWDEEEPAAAESGYSEIEEIPICPMETYERSPEPPGPPPPIEPPVLRPERHFRPLMFKLPPSALLNEAPGRNPYDEQELKDTAVRIKAKFEEFNVLGNVTQINPGPVVTTFEFKPDAGIKYSRMMEARISASACTPNPS